MSVNKHQPHLLVLPEDDANRQLANGFHLGCGQTRQMQILPVAGGWRKVLEEFHSAHVAQMARFTQRLLVLLLDFDRHHTERMAEVRQELNQAPPTVTERVFVLGVLSEPDDLKPTLGPSLETIGAILANECRIGSSSTWQHPLLHHNQPEAERLREHSSILFEPI